jgi:hypothetical protein
MEFEPTIPAFERAKTIHATLIGKDWIQYLKEEIVLLSRNSRGVMKDDDVSDYGRCRSIPSPDRLIIKELGIKENPKKLLSI